MKKAKKIFWTILSDIIAAPVILIMFVFIPILGFTSAKSNEQPGFYGAKECLKEFVEDIKKI